MTVKSVKEGKQTTEFWLTLAVVVLATVLRFTHDIGENTWGLACGLQGAGYALSRGIAKT